MELLIYDYVITYNIMRCSLSKYIFIVTTKTDKTQFKIILHIIYTQIFIIILFS